MFPELSSKLIFILLIKVCEWADKLPGWLGGVCTQKQAESCEGWEHCHHPFQPAYTERDGHKEIGVTHVFFCDVRRKL